VIPAAMLDLVRRFDLWLLCVGMAGVGLQIAFSDLRAAGLKPVVAGIATWIFLSAVSYTLARWLCGRA